MSKAAPRAAAPGTSTKRPTAAEIETPAGLSQQSLRDLEAGRRVLALESAALDACRAALDGAFCEAVERLSEIGGERSGRVVVTGIGKSGHVGRKIAATLASTGTPAQFVHPAEASHGDLGMITDRDAILALSNSGETEELSDVLSYAKRFAIPVIAITARADSTLARLATAALVMPEQPEAATMGLAPTTSTTMAMALGDALAVAILERKGFTASDFRLFHPGGKLGRQLARVGDLMHGAEEMPLVALGTTMREALLVMTSKHFGCVGITDAAGRLAGIVTDGDLRRHMDASLIDAVVDDVMTAEPITIRANTMVTETLAMMNAREITALFVVDDARRPVGIVHIHDFLRAGVA